MIYEASYGRAVFHSYTSTLGLGRGVDEHLGKDASPYEVRLIYGQGGNMFIPVTCFLFQLLLVTSIYKLVMPVL